MCKIPNVLAGGNAERKYIFMVRRDAIASLRFGKGGNMNEIQCPNCKYEGPGKHIMKGAVWLEIVLWLLFIVPGFIYSVWRLTKQIWVCPECDFENIKKVGLFPKRAVWSTLKQSLLIWIITISAVLVALSYLVSLFQPAMIDRTGNNNTAITTQIEKTSKPVLATLPALSLSTLNAIRKDMAQLGEDRWLNMKADYDSAAETLILQIAAGAWAKEPAWNLYCEMLKDIADEHAQGYKFVGRIYVDGEVKKRCF